MLKVKLFAESDEHHLELGVNEFLKKFMNPNNFIEIKYSCSISGDLNKGKLFSALILYKDYSDHSDES
jgi:hypothetical protein